MIYKIYGPPGTGKTHRLINRAKAYVKIGTPLHKIGYFAFTRKAAKEAKERMPIDEKKLVHFQTLHSFAFNTLGLQEENIMQPFHYEELGKKLGVRVKYTDKYNEEETHFLTCNNPYFQLIGRAINRNTSIREEFDRNEHDRKEIKWDTLKYIHGNLLKYKKNAKLNDFNDIINNVLDKVPNFTVVFIDEAQDLSPLQWKLYDKLKENSKDVYLAGDDDQAIFAWAGADVNRFVQEQSMIAIGNISGIKKNKKYYPRDYEGVCEEIYNLDEIDLSKGKWLILARTVSKLLKIQETLFEKGFYYESNNGKSITVSLYKAVKNYERWRKGEELTEEQIKDIKTYTGNVRWNKSENWFNAFALADKDEQEQKEYLVRLFENKEDLESKARIWVSTIHAIKGGEQDNVILCIDLGNKIIKAMNQSSDKADEEHRVWYVAYTRARNNLYLFKLANKTRKAYPI